MPKSHYSGHLIWNWCFWIRCYFEIFGCFKNGKCWIRSITLSQFHYTSLVGTKQIEATLLLLFQSMLVASYVESTCLWFEWLTSYYKDTFPLLDESWRSSFMCFTAFCLIPLFSISNQMFIAFLTLSRFMAVCFQMNAKFKNVGFYKRMHQIYVVATIVFQSHYHNNSQIFLVAYCLQNCACPLLIQQSCPHLSRFFFCLLYQQCSLHLQVFLFFTFPLLNL